MKHQKAKIDPTRTLESFVYYGERIFSSELADRILEEYKDTGLWTRARVLGDKDGVSVPNIRECDGINLLIDDVLTDHEGGIIFSRYSIVTYLNPELTKAYHNWCESCLPKYAHHIFSPDSIELLRYKEGEFYKDHFDLAGERTTTVLVGLNDDYEGGYTQLFNDEEKYKFKLKKGDVLIFPSYWTYPHQVTPVTTGTRYVLVSWNKTAGIPK